MKFASVDEHALTRPAQTSKTKRERSFGIRSRFVFDASALQECKKSRPSRLEIDGLVSEKTCLELLVIKLRI